MSFAGYGRDSTFRASPPPQLGDSAKVRFGQTQGGGWGLRLAEFVRLRAATEALNDIDDVQYRHRGRRHCWYAGGWNGPGWYWCGYGSRRNRGWGGPDGWNNWRRR